MDHRRRLALLVAATCLLLAGCQQDRRGGEPFTFDGQDSGTTVPVESETPGPLEPADSCREYRDYLTRAWTQEILEKRYRFPRQGGGATVSGHSLKTSASPDDQLNQVLIKDDVLNVAQGRQLHRFRLGDRDIEHITTQPIPAASSLEEVGHLKSEQVLAVRGHLLHVVVQKQFRSENLGALGVRRAATLLTVRLATDSEGESNKVRQISIPGRQPETRQSDGRAFITTTVHLAAPHAGLPKSLASRLVALIDEPIDGIRGPGHNPVEQAADRRADARAVIRKRVATIIEELSFPDDLPRFHLFGEAGDAESKQLVDCSDMKLDRDDPGLQATLIVRFDPNTLDVEGQLLLTDQKIRRQQGRWMALATATDGPGTTKAHGTLHLMKLTDTTMMARRSAVDYPGHTSGLFLEGKTAVVDTTTAVNTGRRPMNHRFVTFRAGADGIKQNILLKDFTAGGIAPNYGLVAGRLWWSGPVDSHPNISSRSLASLPLDGESTRRMPSVAATWSRSTELRIGPLWGDFVLLQGRNPDEDEPAFLSGTPSGLQTSPFDAAWTLRRSPPDRWVASREHQSAFLPYKSTAAAERGEPRDSVAVLGFENDAGSIVGWDTLDHRAAVAEACSCEPDKEDIDMQILPKDDYFLIVGSYGVTAHRYDDEKRLVGGAAYD